MRHRRMSARVTHMPPSERRRSVDLHGGVERVLQPEAILKGMKDVVAAVLVEGRGFAEHPFHVRAARDAPMSSLKDAAAELRAVPIAARHVGHL